MIIFWQIDLYKILVAARKAELELFDALQEDGLPIEVAQHLKTGHKLCADIAKHLEENYREDGKFESAVGIFPTLELKEQTCEN